MISMKAIHRKLLKAALFSLGGDFLFKVYLQDETENAMCLIFRKAILLLYCLN